MWMEWVDVLSYALIRLPGLPDLQPKNSTLMAMYPYQPHGWMRRCRVWIGGLSMFSARLTRSRLAVKYWGNNKEWIHISNDCLLKIAPRSFSDFGTMLCKWLEYWQVLIYKPRVCTCVSPARLSHAEIRNLQFIWYRWRRVNKPNSLLCLGCAVYKQSNAMYLDCKTACIV